jgi:hypothetical protein
MTPQRIRFRLLMIQLACIKANIEQRTRVPLAVVVAVKP